MSGREFDYEFFIDVLLDHSPMVSLITVNIDELSLTVMEDTAPLE